jgi:hypothetical protein
MSEGKKSYFETSIPNLKKVFNHFEKRRNGLDLLNICDKIQD